MTTTLKFILSRKTRLLIYMAAAFSACSPSFAKPVEMNSYILKAVSLLANERSGGGYDINKAYSQNLQYQKNCCIKATDPPRTMCVAAVTETIIESLNMYSVENPDGIVQEKLPIEKFQKSNRTSLRPYLFQYVEEDENGKKHSVSNGIADAFQKFGIGEQLPFESLLPGDVINFNRATAKPSGHAVIFLGYVNKEGKLEKDYGSKVSGFRYFSAQGKRDDGGFGYRNAFFDGFCPNNSAQEFKSDCKVIRSSDPKLFNSGRLWLPTEWKVEQAIRKIEKELEARVVKVRGKERDEAFGRAVTTLLNENLEPSDLSHLNAE